LPVRLRDDADAKALSLQQPSHDGHAEAGVIDVGIAGDDDDVAGVPAELVHLFARHGQEGCSAKTAGPVLAVGIEFFGSGGGGHLTTSFAEMGWSPSAEMADCHCVRIRTGTYAG
jgi:hypothetical protein